MKKEFETPVIEIIYFDQSVKLQDESDFHDENLDDNGWI